MITDYDLAVMITLLILTLFALFFGSLTFTGLLSITVFYMVIVFVANFLKNRT